MIVTSILLGTVLATLIPLLNWVARAEREAERRQFAQQTAANVLEELTARDSAELNQQAADEFKLSADSVATLPDVRLKVTVTPTQEKPEGKRIDVVLEWANRPELPNRPVRLTTWVFADGENQP